MSDYALDTIVLTLLWAALAGAWNLFCGYGGQLSMGHTVFLGIGAYTSTLLLVDGGVSPWVGMLAGMFLAAVVAVVIGAITIRLRGPFFTLATIAAGEVFRSLAVAMRGLTKGSVGISIHLEPGLGNMWFAAKWPYLALAAGFALAVFAVTWWQERSRYGFLLRAMGEDEDVAEMLGVDTLPLRLGSLAASAALTAACGTLYAQYVTFIDPESVFNVNVSVQMALIAIIGGSGTTVGPLLGSAIMTPLAAYVRGLLAQHSAGLYLMAYASALILVALFMPRGLAGTVLERWRRWERRTASGTPATGD